jgi:hypothetical protein
MNKLQALLQLAEAVTGPSTESAAPLREVSGQQIVILDRGFVYVGECRREGDCLVITNAKNIRKWGTTQGLGQLRNGPLSDTVTDDVGEVIAPWKSVINLIQCKGF